MKYGLSFLPDASEDQLSAASYYDCVLELARMADTRGLATVKMTQHWLHDYGGYCPDPLAFLSAVAAQTSRVRLMTGGVLTSFAHPVATASSVAQLDVISHGRVDLGCVRGYLPHEFEAFGIPVERSRPRFEQSVDAIERLLRERDVTIEGSDWAIADATIRPRPIQVPGPPIWCAAARTPETMVWIAERGYGLMLAIFARPIADVARQIEYYRHRSPDGKVTALAHLVVAQSDAEARDLARSHCQKYLDVWASAADGWNSRFNHQYAGYTDMGRWLRSIDPDSLLEMGTLIAGSADTVRASLARISAELPCDQLLFNVDFGAMPPSAAYRTVELLTREVLEGGRLAPVSRARAFVEESR